MPPRAESDEKYILDLVSEVLAEPDYRWQHCFPSLLGDEGQNGKRRPLPVDGYFPRHRLIVEYWEMQHSASVPIMDEGSTVSGVSRGHQRRLYDQRRQAWADRHRLKLVILDYRGFRTDGRGKLVRDAAHDLRTVADALRDAGVLDEPSRVRFEVQERTKESGGTCFLCQLAQDDPALPPHHTIWRNEKALAVLNRLPTVYGQVLVAPAAHLEHVTGDFTLHQYLELQRAVYAVAEAVRLELRPERVYVLSMGSQQGTAHLHWHIVPCPPGVPPEHQQLALLNARERGMVPVDQCEGVALASRLRKRLPDWMRRGAR